MMPGIAEQQTHDYKHHRSKEFLAFLKEIDARVAGDPDIYLIMDNYATCKTPAIRNWLAKRPHWHVHFTPTGASWLNMVERFFAEIIERQIKPRSSELFIAVNAN